MRRARAPGVPRTRFAQRTRFPPIRVRSSVALATDTGTGTVMQRTRVRNVLLQAARPDRLPVMLGKVWRRMFDAKGGHSRTETLAWIESHRSSFEAYASACDAELWAEALANARLIEDRADEVLRNVEYELGGGGIYPLLYFIVRYMRPEVVVETGVAAGFSSYAFLLAIRHNGRGRLYSSDFPYFRLPNPERFVGIVVEDSLKRDWELYMDGDDKNLPIIAGKVERIDIFHYDSDKSYAGRQRALKIIETKLTEDGVILMDDIQDNSFFRDYIDERRPDSWRVFEFEGKYVGMIGDPRRRPA